MSNNKRDPHGNKAEKALVTRWSDLTGSSSGAMLSPPVLSLAELSSQLQETHSSLEYQRQIVNSLQAKVCLMEKEMKRLTDENEYLVKCVQDPEFPQRQKSMQTMQQLKQLQEARRGRIQPVYRPG